MDSIENMLYVSNLLGHSPSKAIHIISCRQTSNFMPVCAFDSMADIVISRSTTTGFGLEVDRDHFDNMLAFNLKDGKQWRKRIYPRIGYPNKLLRWATAEVCGSVKIDMFYV